MKSVLISIQPKWVEKICNGEKTIEVRKTKPKLEVPFKCYIYCTKDNKTAFNNHNGNMFLSPKGWQDYSECNGKVIGEFVCDRIYDIKPYFDRPDLLTQYECGWKHGEEFDCLSFSELNSYLREDNGYGWHISNLKIYDKPKELSEFGQKCDMAYEIRCRDCLIRKGWNECCEVMCKPLKRPPQSWCYVESLGD